MIHGAIMWQSWGNSENTSPELQQPVPGHELKQPGAAQIGDFLHSMSGSSSRSWSYAAHMLLLNTTAFECSWFLSFAFFLGNGALPDISLRACSEPSHLPSMWPALRLE